jgi:WD40 repeat protein
MVTALSGAPIRTLLRPGRPLSGLVMAPDGSWFAGWGKESGLTVWDTASGAALHQLAGDDERICAVAVAPDGGWLVGGGDGTLRAWNARTGTVLGDLTGATGSIRGIAVSRDGRWAAAVSDDQVLYAWSTEGWSRIATLRLDAQLRSVAIGPNNRLAVGSSAGIFVFELVLADHAAVARLSSMS